jgi:hypothetical protein
VVERFDPVQGAPIVTDPETKRRIDPTSLHLTYQWFSGSNLWLLVWVRVDGVAIHPDGTYDPDGYTVECEFYDPAAETEENGGFPDWAKKVAADRMWLLPLLNPPPF